MTIFEIEENVRREKKAIETFVNTFGGSYKKLDQLDIDFKIFDKDNKLIAYVEVTPRFRNIRDAYPLPIPAKKLIKLIDKRITPVLMWSCDDGIIYSTANKVSGQIMYGKDQELTVYYDWQREFKYVRFSK